MPSSSPSASPSDMPSSAPTIPDKLYMDFEPIWVEIVFPKGMKSPSSNGRGGKNKNKGDREDTDGGGDDMLAMARSSTTKNGKDDEEVFSTIDTITRKQSKIMASYIDNIVTEVVNDQLALINYFFWEAYLDADLVDKTTVYPPGTPLGSGEEGTAARLEAELAGETQLALKYEVTGQYSFVNITDTVLPSPFVVKAATAEALNLNVFYRELKRSEHPMLSEVELVKVNWATYGANGDNSTTYKILGSVIFVMLLILAGGVGFVYYKRRRIGNSKGRGGLAAMEVANNGTPMEDGDSSWFSGDESSVHRLSAWRGGNKTSPGKTAEDSMVSESFASEGDLAAANNSADVSIPHGDDDYTNDKESSILSTSPAKGAVGSAKVKSREIWNRLAARARGRRGYYRSDVAADASTNDPDSMSKYDDDSVLPSEVASNIDTCSDVAGESMADMTANFSFTNIASPTKSIRERREVDLLYTCGDCGLDQSILSGESNVSMPRAFQIEPLSSFNNGGSEVDPCPSILQSEAPSASKVGDTSKVDESIGGNEHPLTDTADGDNADAAAVAAVVAPDERRTANNNPLRATLAKVWHRKKKDTPSKLSPTAVTTMSAGVPTAAVAAENKVGEETKTPSEIGSCKHEDIQVLDVSDEMSCVSALSIGGVSTMSMNTGIASTGQTQSHALQVMSPIAQEKESPIFASAPAVEPLRSPSVITGGETLQNTTIPEAEAEDSSNDGATKSKAESVPHMMAHAPDSESEESGSGEDKQKPMVEEAVAPEKDAVELREKEEGAPPRSGEDKQKPMVEEAVAPEKDVVELREKEEGAPSVAPELPPALENEQADAQVEETSQHVLISTVLSTTEEAPVDPQDRKDTVPVVQNKQDNAEGVASATILDESADYTVPTVFEEDTSSAQGSQLGGGERGATSADTRQDKGLTEEEDIVDSKSTTKPIQEQEYTAEVVMDADIRSALEANSNEKVESSEDELDEEIKSAMEDCSMISESEEEDDASANESSSDDSSNLIKLIIPRKPAQD